MDRSPRHGRESLEALACAIEPGGRIERLRPLRGGLDATMHAFVLLAPDGSRKRLVLRRYRPAVVEHDPTVVRRAWRTLSALQALALPAPRPVWLDPAGGWFGAPALVMTHIDGTSRLHWRSLEQWTAELAQALAALHSTRLRGVDPGFLPGPGEAARQLLAPGLNPGSRFSLHPDGAAILQALDRPPEPAAAARPVLVHGDYWAGNTVWRGGRVAGIVDWDSAALDDPGVDVGYCRMDLAMLADAAAPDLFLRAYEGATRQRVTQLWRWDLLAAASALPDPGRWLPGYHGLGRGEITADDMRRRLRDFIAQALDRAAAETA